MNNCFHTSRTLMYGSCETSYEFDEEVGRMLLREHGTITRIRTRVFLTKYDCGFDPAPRHHSGSWFDSLAGA